MKIKSSWDEITIEDFIAIKAIESSEKMNDLEKRIAILESLSNVESGYFDSYSIPEIKELLSKTSFISEFPKWEIKNYYDIGEIKYKLIKEVKDLSSGQMIDLMNYTKDPNQILANLHLICTVLLLPTKPVKKLFGKTTYLTEKYGQTSLEETANNIFKNMKIYDAYSVAFFFSLLFEAFLTAIKHYSGEEAKSKYQLALKTLKKENPKLAEKMETEIGSTINGLGS